MDRYFASHAPISTAGVESVQATAVRISPDFPRLELAKGEILKHSGITEEDANWWDSGTGFYFELHRHDGSWTGYAIRKIPN